MMKYSFKLLPALIVLSVGVQASPIQHSLSVSATAEHDSNPAMSSTNSESVNRAIITPSYTFKRVKDNTELSLNAKLILERSSDESLSIDREDPSANLDWILYNPRGSLSLGLSYVESATRISELEDTGLLSADATREKTTAKVGWNRELDEVNTLVLDLAYDDVSYSAGNFTDYNNTSLSARLNHKLDELRTVFGKLSADYYEPGDNTPESEQYNLGVGLDWQHSELLSTLFEAGINYNDNTSDTGWTASADVNYNEERYSTTLGYSRSSSASGSGGFSESDSINLTGNYLLDDYSSIGASLSWRDNRSADNQSTLFRIYGNRELSEDLSLNVSYQYKETESTTSDADADIFSVMLSYQLSEL